jgi:RimJ/RimL family protein N-acetyltransferase
MGMDRPEIRIAGMGVALREWTAGDLPAMVEIFDDPEVAYRTPVASPFDLDAAGAYLQRIKQAGAEGTRMHLAITVDGGKPHGEVLLNLATGSIAYTVGVEYRGQALARRAAALVTDYAHHVIGMAQVRAEIEPDNYASIAVAERLGYRLSDEEPATVDDGRRSFTLSTWIHHAPAAADEAIDHDG